MHSLLIIKLFIGHLVKSQQTVVVLEDVVVVVVVVVGYLAVFVV